MRNRNHTIYFLVLTLFLLLLVVADLVFGTLRIPTKELIHTLTQSEQANEIYSEIIFNIRLPKAITAIFVGVSLSIAGLMMQTLFRNPLADPYILGVSSGASLGVAIIVMLSGVVPLFFAGSWGMILAAVIGATIVMLIVIAISYKVESAVSLLIVGIMLGTITASVVSIIQYFSSPDSIKIFIIWSLGSLSSVTWSHLSIVVPFLLVGVAISIYLQKRLDALLLGENYAQGLGVPIRSTRTLIVISTAILAGSITAFTGPIAFVGIAVPHIARGVFKTANHATLIPASAIIGAYMILICDIISQIPQYPLPINTISALFGAPIIIWIILKRR